MGQFSVLGREWKIQLSKLVQAAKCELLISSPFVSCLGTDFVVERLSTDLRESGTIRILTNLSPMNVCQGSTDPAALRSLLAGASACFLYHLPHLHAKVYVGDTDRAIVSSGNLTSGGLLRNYEYGVETVDRQAVQTIREDMAAYAELGVRITEDRLSRYCKTAGAAQRAFAKKHAGIVRSAQRQFDLALRDAEDELVRFRLAGGAMHTVFEKTIVYLLGQHGPLRTTQLHPLIERIHPELCDNTIDRVIGGKRFGKKWKHAVRTAQQQLKSKGLITLKGDRWMQTATR